MKKIIIAIIVISLIISTAPLGMGRREAINGTLSNGEMEDNNLMSTFYGNILYVGGDGPGNYSSIQEAIDNATVGDTVYVYSGTYYEGLVIHKSIDLVGEDREITIIDGVDSFGIINVSANSVKITGFTIQNDSSCLEENVSRGVTIESYCHDVIITGNTITDTICAILVDEGSHNNIISKNKIHNNSGCGISVFLSNNNKIIENIIVDNSEWGIYVPLSDYNLFANNKIENHNYSIILSDSDNNFFSGNNIKNSSIGIWMVVACGLNTICENTIADNHLSIFLSYYNFKNSFYHNNFINNTQKPYDPDYNTWDNGYPSGGNYWDDYDGIDNYHGPNQDINGSDGIGDTSYLVCFREDRYPFINPYGWINEPPNTPTIDGPISGKAGVEYDYKFVAADPEGYDVYYLVDWGDGNNTSWIGPYISGEEVTVSYSWSEQGTYTISAKAKDTRGAESEWGILTVTMPKNQAHQQSQQHLQIVPQQITLLRGFLINN